MTEFEFSRYVTIGQYLPTGSIIHRLDPRARLVSTLLLLASITLAPRPAGQIVALVVLVLLFLIARVPLGYALRGLLAPFPFIALLALIQILVNLRPEAGQLLFTFGPLRVSEGDLLAALRLILQFAALFLTLTLASCTIATSELLRGLHALLAPLARLGVPTHAFILTVQVTLRFLPLLALEAERIAKAQASRGAEWGTRQGGLLRRARQVLPIIVPLFLTTLQRAERLALAMEARGYDSSRQRTSMVALRFRAVDALALVLMVGVAVVVVGL